MSAVSSSSTILHDSHQSNLNNKKPNIDPSKYVQRGPYILTNKLQRKIFLTSAQVIAPKNMTDNDSQLKAITSGIEGMKKALTDITIRLIYRGNQGPKNLSKNDPDTQLSTLNSQKQQTVTLMCRIYIGSINFSVTEDMIRIAFSPFGPVKHINMSLDLTTNRHKGFAFLEFETPEAAYLSLTQMEGVVLGGRNIKVGRPTNMPLAEPMINQLLEEAKAYARIYISSIHPSITKEDILSIFEPFGTIKSSNMPMNTSKPNMHCGYCYIEYENMKSAEDAVMTMNLFELMGYYLRVGKAVTPPLANPIKNCAQAVDEVAKMAQLISNKLSQNKEQKNSIEKSKMSIKFVDDHIQYQKSSPGRELASSHSSLNNYNSKNTLNNQNNSNSSFIQSSDSVMDEYHSKNSKTYNDSNDHTKKAPYNSESNINESNNSSKSSITKHVENQLDSILDSDIYKSNNNHHKKDSYSSLSKIENNAIDKTHNYNHNKINGQPGTNEFKSLPKKVNSSNVELEPTGSLQIEENGNYLRGSEAKELHMHKLMRVKEQKVVVLSNMVDISEVDDYLEEEVKSECEKYAQVKRVIIYIQDEYQNNKTVHIFIECSNQEEATKLKDVMNGRYFAQRLIEARFYDQELYDECYFRV